MNNNLYLKYPSMDDYEEWIRYTNEYFDKNSNCVVSGFAKNTDYKEWLNRINNERNGILEKDRVPASFYFMMNDDEIVGCISIRHNLNTDFLRRFGGHIGYNIRPSERGKGYGTKMLYLALFKCEELGLSDVMITCKKDNIASAKVIENNGGKLQDEVFIPEEDDIFRIYWVNVYESFLKNDIGKTI